MPHAASAGAGTSDCFAHGSSAARGARAALIERRLHLARSHAGSCRRSGAPVEDLVQVAWVAPVKAIGRYDADRGARSRSSRSPRSAASSTSSPRPHLGGATAARRPSACVAGRCGAHPPGAEARPPADDERLGDSSRDQRCVGPRPLLVDDGWGRSSLHGPIGKRAGAATLEDWIAAEDPDLSQVELRPTSTACRRRSRRAHERCCGCASRRT
jgi:hypothetical protein